MIRELGYTPLHIDLPEKVAQAFYDLGDAQRGKPEAAMLKINHFYAGVACPVFEHGGDLTWRMSHWAKWPRGNMDFECIIKAERCVRYLTGPYGFEKEMRENIINNARAMKLPLEEYQEKLNKLMLSYSKEHSLLVVYNEPQWWARRACIEMGQWHFDKALEYFRKYALLGKNEKKFAEAAYAYTLDPSGKPTPYMGFK
jgi:hypothetical protein